MGLKEQLLKDRTAAMKNKEDDKRNLLRLVISDVEKAEISNKGELSETQIETILNNEANKVKETLTFLEKDGSNQKEIDKNNYWLEILYGYLPERLSEAQVKVMIDEIIAENGYQGKKDMKQVMPKIISLTKNKFDGKVVRELVEKALS